MSRAFDENGNVYKFGLIRKRSSFNDYNDLVLSNELIKVELAP